MLKKIMLNKKPHDILQGINYAPINYATMLLDVPFVFLWATEQDQKWK